jgi:nodulation protein E
MTESRPRVLVTGMGAITAAGVGVGALWAAARAGRSGIGEAKLSRDGPNRVKLAAQVPGFEPEQFIESSRLPFCDRFAQLAIAAATEALTQAGLPRSDKLGQRTAVIIGTGVGGITTVDDVLHGEYALKSRTNPWAVPRIMGIAAASHISILYGCTGPTFGVTSACVSGSQAIGLGAYLIRSGVVDRAIVGGSDSSMTPMNIRVWELLRVLTNDACRPFSLMRNGMVLGEGAAVLVLESEQTTRTRQATPLAEIAGYGTSSDAFDIVRSDPSGATTAMELAIAESSLRPDQICYVNAHGTGTIANDIAETEALRRVFGRRLPELAISSTKPIHGHTLGAAGAIELVITIMAMRTNTAPPTINWLGPDPKCDLDPVPNVARKLPIRVAMSNSFAFGGINACLVITATE